jgi:hypothetical protein
MHFIIKLIPLTSIIKLKGKIRAKIYGFLDFKKPIEIKNIVVK